MKLKRRDFMKMCGIAAAIPSILLKVVTRPVKVFGKESMILDGEIDVSKSSLDTNLTAGDALAIDDDIVISLYDGKWHHLIIQRNPNNIEEVCKLYLDGKEISGICFEQFGFEYKSHNWTNSNLNSVKYLIEESFWFRKIQANDKLT